MNAPLQSSAANGLLHVSLPRRVVLQHREGIPTIYFGKEVIAFDEPALAPLAGLLAAGQPFMAAGACPTAAPDQLAEALATLRDIGLLADHAAMPAPQPVTIPALTSCPVAMDWRDPAQVSQALDLPLHAAHLELIVPIFRIAHPVLDADDRQVGEANTFPRALRLDRPTEWQACTYSGTRHRDEKPMNLTALKAMRAHWPQMMALLAEIRSTYLLRAGISGPLTLGQIERLCIAVLSLPTWEAFGEGPLHPVLSSLFRVTDGLRIVVHQMMFVPVAEPMLPPQTRVTAAEIFDYAERSLSFHSDTGVCAGPQHFIAEFLAVLVEGAPSRLGPGGDIGAELAPALGRLGDAMDYAFAALAAHAASFAIWPEMAETWSQIAALAAGWPAGLSPELDAFRAEVAEASRRLDHASYLARAEWRDLRLATYAEMEREALRLCGLAPSPAAQHRTCPDAGALAMALPGLPEPRALAALLQGFARRAGDHLARAVAIQAQISERLGRAKAPGFSLADLILHDRLVASPHPRLQFLPEVLFRLTGLALQVETLPDPQIGHPKSMQVDQPRNSRTTQGEVP